ncbi:transposase [Alteribacillus sp. JSM 102045]|uniref:transposase n=1 Tax=Alteribacillus sp. JSM 102045 TaxID=1562101 RepID=UPI0035BF4FA5
MESVFGHVKQNLGYQRFLLRGLEKVHVEFGWVALRATKTKNGSYTCNEQKRKNPSGMVKRDSGSIFS